MTILVTGGAGFVGSHLVEHLLATSAQPLVVLDNFNDYYDPRLKQTNVAAWSGDARVTLVDGDFGDPDVADEVLLAHQVRAICHLGASPGVPASLLHPRQFLENNVVGTATLLEATRRHPVKRFPQCRRDRGNARAGRYFGRCVLSTERCHPILRRCVTHVPPSRGPKAARACPFAA